MAFWCFAYVHWVKLRQKAASLKDQELSNFVCRTVLLGGVGAMAPMVFFNFEIVSCLTDIRVYPLHHEDVRMCQNTSNAAMWLSCYLVIVASVSIIRRVSSRARNKEALTYERVARFELREREKIQGALVATTTFASMYIFSVLGVRGEPSNNFTWVGLVGLVCLLCATLIEIISLSTEQGVVERGQDQDHLTRGFKSERRLSVTGVEDEMTVVGYV